MKILNVMVLLASLIAIACAAAVQFFVLLTQMLFNQQFDSQYPFRQG